MNYAETKKELDRIRNEYGCKGEILFRTALQTVVEYGTDSLLDDWNYAHLEQEVNERHDAAEAEGEIVSPTRNFELAILECAREIAKVSIYNLLVYIQKEVWLSNDGGIDYDRAVKLLKRCMNYVEQTHCGLWETYDVLDEIGFNDDEIEMLGFDYLFDVRKEEEDD